MRLEGSLKLATSSLSMWWTVEKFRQNIPAQWWKLFGKVAECGVVLYEALQKLPIRRSHCVCQLFGDCVGSFCVVQFMRSEGFTTFFQRNFFVLIHTCGDAFF